MDQMEIRQLVARQRAYFQSGATLPARARVEALRALRSAVAAREEELNDALRADLGKSAFESYMCEVGMVLSELTYMIRRTPAFAADRRVRTPLAQFAARSYVKPSPYGTVLIMSPWNYPLLLTLDPLIDALAAGNTAVVKPGAYSPATSRVIARLLAECFPPEHVSVVTGGRQENACLLEQKFDYIFFTGSQAVGREVLLHAAQYLTPVTLELGGKSPCIVDETADLKLTARRIVFGKYLKFGPAPLDSPSYGKIVNQKHFQRLLRLIQPEKVVCGGTWQEEALRIAPTVMDAVTWQDPVMGEEIFGPILPVLTFSHIPEVLELLKDRPKPLALYLFSRNKGHIRAVTERCSFGGGCVNDVVIHLATSAMGFGGVGESGMGAYHGRVGFETFSHRKSIVDKKTWMDLPMRYQPYLPLHEKLIRRFLR